MKHLLYIILIIGSLYSCNSEDANDCIQNSGKIIREELSVPMFNKILVNRNIELILTQGTEIKVIIETGKHLINDIKAYVTSNRLELTNNNTCNFIRDYNITKVYVTAPNITEIRSSTQNTIRSIGVLNFEKITLISEDFNLPNSITNGDFVLELNTITCNITSNNIASFHISGKTETLSVGFFAGVGRFEGGNLIANNVKIFHRGSNDIIVNPQETLRGELLSSGNLISKNRPPIVEVDVRYRGDLIFN